MVKIANKTTLQPKGYATFYTTQLTLINVSCTVP
jgi:hypothetical protein